MENNNTTKQLCGKCSKEFDSTDPDADEFIFALCDECKNEEEKPKPSKKKRSRK